ncbi:MAG TPA: hypothetical protein VMA72_27325 [Streptosporangiaceae bacterium]|nr:hypothetical protein [Streptosporangiaceae bacterium]
MKYESEAVAGPVSNPAASADADQHVREEIEEIEERARVAGRQLSRSWVLRLAAVAAGLIAASMARRRRAARRASAR